MVTRRDHDPDRHPAPILSANSLLPCTVGGRIKITNPGQTTFFIDAPIVFAEDVEGLLMGWCRPKTGTCSSPAPPHSSGAFSFPLHDGAPHSHAYSSSLSSR